MKSTFLNAEDILNRCIGGFHQYILSDPVRLSAVSDNFCEMTGYTEAELIGGDGNPYEKLVYSADLEIYNDFLARLQSGERTFAVQYRLVKKNGDIMYVLENATAERLRDGTLICNSSLADVSEIKNENENLQFLNETIPCGFLKYTCEKQPKITYMNRQMMDFLRFPRQKEGELDYLEMYRNNVFIMIPMEERRRFSLYLNRVYSAGIPIAGDITLLRCDGTRAYVFGWVTKCVNEQGKEEFQSVCMDITERHRAKKDNERRQYLNALSDVYDKIFEYNLATGTVKCLRSSNSPMFKWMENIPMQMDEATEKWISDTVVDEEREKVREFFRRFCQKQLPREEGNPPQITYRAQSTSGDIKTYRGVLIKIEESVSLFCLRCLRDHDVEHMKRENAALKESIQELVMNFTDGIAAFVVQNGSVTPLYASENMSEFFGLTKEEWLPLMGKSTPIRDFVSHSDTEYEEFVRLLRNGEGEFVYYDLNTESERRIKAVCSTKSSDDESPRYVMLYKVDEKDDANDVQAVQSEVVIRTFGYFDVFVDGKAIAFRNKKSKELFALLVDRRGGYVASEEAIGFLWEDEPINAVTLARYRKVALRLKNILMEYGISDIIETVDGKRRIVTEKVKCDLYDYLSGKEEYISLFKGSYLTNYSWAETTLAELTGNFYG